ncbi:conserved hypothetical protein [Mucor ambiguus]|uniref:Uncharacterized protein n=1 Tax=Mucor ambiguus TaxID=91626 RepID=A0A0C9MVU4_9FUNG|nr:conserved hypothetical protein [Mucor ambiguus]
MPSNNETLHLLDSSEEDGSSSDSSYRKQQPKKSVGPPSGISNLFNNHHHKGESKPLNAFIATTNPPPVQYNNEPEVSNQDMSSSSYRSSAYFTASLPNSIAATAAEETDPLLLSPIAITTTATTPSSPHYLSRTLSSSNYFDNQSDYEVILDDGTRQKRTISLSTVQIYPSHSSNNQTKRSSSSNYLSVLNRWISRKGQSKKRSIATSKDLSTPADLTAKSNMPLSLSSSSDDDDDEEEEDGGDGRIKKRKYQQLSTLKRYAKHWTAFQDQYLTLSHKQKMVLKCSFAYMIGSLFTFVPQLNALCGTHIASHMIATVTLFFNPAKTVGGMVEAAGFGWLYTLAALTLSLASMYTTDYFLDNEMTWMAYSVSLGVWLAGSTFVISYLKAKLNTPSVLTASGLAFIILFTVIVREGSGNEAEFDFDIITDTFSTVAFGTIISVAICIFVWPMTATQKLRSNIDSSLSSTRILLKLLTKTFLLDADLPEFTANKTLETAFKTHRASFTALKPALKDASLEFYNLEMQYHAKGYKTIVKSLERLAQHIGGLRSSCGLQVEVMQQTAATKLARGGYGAINNNSSDSSDMDNPVASSSTASGKETFNVKAGPQRKKMECELKRERQSASIATPADYFSMSTNEDPAATTSRKSEGALVQFIRSVRSPMKSLAYTCKQTIVHLQARFTQKTTQTTPSFRLMRQNLASAIELFEASQHKALMRFYKRKFKKQQQKNIKSHELHSLFLKQKQDSADDVFLVYFFVFCLLEFAKELMVLVESVQYVFEDMEESDQSENTSSWIRYLFKRKHVYSPQDDDCDAPSDTDFTPNNHNTLNTLHTPLHTSKVRRFLLKLWSFFSGFRTYRVKFAIKSMLTAELISILAFIPATRPYFTEFKLEWTLITVMAIMTPTLGGTNLGAVLRVIATVLGCVLAAIIYTIFQDNTIILWLCTWLVSIPSFWLILHHKHGRFGLFTLLAYNLIVLYKFNHRLDDSVDVFELAWMRCLAVSVGVILGLFVTAYVWPYEARREVRKGLSDLLLTLSWLYKQLVSVYSEEDLPEAPSTTSTQTAAPYSQSNTLILARKNRARAAELQKIELSIQVSIFDLQGLLVHAPNEPRLKGPFPVKTYSAMLACCQSILDRLLSLRIVILKDVWAIHVRRNFLMPASNEFMEMAGNVFLYFYLLASALQLKTPLPPYLPPAEKTRQLLIQKLQQLPLVMEMSLHEHELAEEKKDECYMVYYAYVVLMENIIRELEMLGDHMKDLFGSLVPEDQWMRCFGQHMDLEQSQIA